MRECTGGTDENIQEGQVRVSRRTGESAQEGQVRISRRDR